MHQPSRRFKSVQAIRAAAMVPRPDILPCLIAALGHRDARMRDAALAALPAYGDAGVYALLRAAAHGNRWQRREAVACLGEWRDVRALQPLLAALENDRRERNARTALRFLCATAATLVFDPLAAPLWAQPFTPDTELQVCAARALSNLGDVRAILPLIRLGRERHAEVRFAAHDALMQLLPRAAELSPEQARALGPNAVLEIASLLTLGDEPLVRWALAVLHVIGDGQALPAVHRLAWNSDWPYLNREADRLAEVLIARAAREQLRTSLLRGSRGPQGSASAQLLRPVGSQPTSIPSLHLLRPCPPDTNGDGVLPRP
jgi:HEAT repeat protein